ncbi:hypothetical protein [Rubritalea marina]|uniref:CIS tube protein n=1 Tax=Rubritalea marina TaxID=361055 RepID=UPI000382CD23|nr:hypothetical protein [Rubritalea marina]
MPEQLTITAYKDYNYTDTTGKFEVLVNPANYDTKQSIQYAEEQALGSPGSEPRFQSIPSEDCKLTLLFDGTGIIPSPPASLKGKSVPEQIDAFLKVTSDYSGNIHSPPPLELVWSDFTFKGVLADMKVNYKIFKPDGTPVRAEVDATFKTASSTQESLLQAKKSSPDMTHIKTMKAQQSIQHFCQQIYGGENYFVQVATANQLDHLRGNKVGQQLVFPPLVNK